MMARGPQVSTCGSDFGDDFVEFGLGGAATDDGEGLGVGEGFDVGGVVHVIDLIT
jgi:hypothetical protein